MGYHIEYTSPIDPHVHLRRKGYKKNYLELGFRDAKTVGLGGILEQPNTEPGLTNEEEVVKRVEEIDKYKGNIHYGMHIGLTKNLNQVRKALELVMNNKYGLASDKTFYVHSTGNMGILDHDLQEKIWEIKGEMRYNGVSIGHFEDEDWFAKTKFDYINPWTHSERRRPESELVQVERQIRNAADSKFRGVFYIAHVSNPETMRYVNKQNFKFEVVVEATFHHIFLNTDDYAILGNKVKVNPPLRSRKLQEELLLQVLNGGADVIGSDHAAHDYDKRISEEPPSGIHSLLFWPKGIELLRHYGMKEELLEDLTFNNANQIFKLGLQKRKVCINCDEELWEELWQSYGYNPFQRTFPLKYRIEPLSNLCKY